MEQAQYNKIFECINELRKEIEINEAQSDSIYSPIPSPNIDIISITAERINSGSINVYIDSHINWEEVTMFDLNNIKKLLSLVDTSLLNDVGNAIIKSIDGKYDLTNPYYKPEVTSGYYNPSTATLWEQGDWNYEECINFFVEELTEKRNKAKEYEQKMNLKQQRTSDSSSTHDIRLELDKANETILELKQKIREHEDAELINEMNLEEFKLTCGPYKIANQKKTAFMSVIWVLKELNYFVKQADNNFATNRTDVIKHLMEGNCNADQLLPKSLKTDTFMNVFHDMIDKASKMVADADNKG